MVTEAPPSPASLHPLAVLFFVLGFFHIFEFLLSLYFHPDETNRSSFLITWSYSFFTLFGICEFVIEALLAPQFKRSIQGMNQKVGNVYKSYIFTSENWFINEFLDYFEGQESKCTCTSPNRDHEVPRALNPLLSHIHSTPLLSSPTSTPLP